MDIVLHGGEDVWASGGGQGTLTVRPEHQPTLTTAFNSERGFALDYGDKTRAYESFVEYASDGPVTVFIGGNAELLPANRFVPPETAWLVFEDFLDGGKRSERVAWKQR